MVKFLQSLRPNSPPVVHQWAVPACCFGSVSGKGFPEALYIAKHAAESSALLPTPPVFVQLDLSQAFDSLFVNSILAFMKEHWAASTALSASLLRWLLVHSRLRFELFDHSWWCDQNRGTQQGGSHSPTLFGRIVAARFEQLTCVLGSSLSLLPGCLAAYPLVTTSTCLLGFPLTEMNKSLISCVAVPRLPSSPIVLFLSTVVLPICNGCAFSMPSLRRRFGGPFVFCPSSKVSFSVFVFIVSPC